MDLAKKEAKKAYLLNEIPVGAILVDNATNLPISSAHNEAIKQKNSTKHAEMILIEKACKIKQCKYLINTSIFITLEPCAMCAAAISEVRIDKIYFGAYDEKNGGMIVEKLLEDYGRHHGGEWNSLMRELNRL